MKMAGSIVYVLDVPSFLFVMFRGGSQQRVKCELLDGFASSHRCVLTLSLVPSTILPEPTVHAHSTLTSIIIYHCHHDNVCCTLSTREFTSRETSRSRTHELTTRESTFRIEEMTMQAENNVTKTKQKRRRKEKKGKREMDCNIDIIEINSR
jgi:hypothetical protein